MKLKTFWTVIVVLIYKHIPLDAAFAASFLCY